MGHGPVSRTRRHHALLQPAQHPLTLLKAAQHPPTHLLLQACRSVDAWKVAVEALERATELGIYAGVARYNMVLKWLCNQRALSEARQ